MKLLILSFYFPPDLSAGSFRTSALVKALQEIRPDLDIEVVTTLPNRYASFSSEAPALEQADHVTIQRIKLPAHRSGMWDQARAFLGFAREARRLTIGKHYNLIYATSGRLMTAALGTYLAGQLKAPLYLDIRDIFVDTVKDVLPHFAPIAKPLFSMVERRAITAARSVNLVSGGFKPYFESRYSGQRFTYFTNGVDDEFIDLSFPPPGRSEGDPLSVLYAGNIGEGQGLHMVLPDLARRMAGRVNFRVFGDGGRRAALEGALSAVGVTNVEILPPVARDRLIAEYAAADVLFLHLNDYDAFRKVLPSKLFEYAATGKPIWAGLAGYSAEFATAEIANVAVFPPCRVELAMEAFGFLDLASVDRSRFTSKYARTKIMKELAYDIVQSLVETNVL